MRCVTAALATLVAPAIPAFAGAAPDAADAPESHPTSSVPTSSDIPHYEVRATIDVDARRVDLHVAIDLPASYESPVLWLYADRMRDVPPSFDEFEAERIYTFGIDRGGYDELTVELRGCAPQKVAPAAPLPARRTRGRDVPVAVCPAAHPPFHLDVQGALTVAHRYGSLAAASGSLVLGDPWYPLVLPSAASELPPLADHRVYLTPQDRRTVATASGAVSVDDAHPSALVEQHAVSHAPAVILPPGRAYVSDRYAGVDLTLVSDSGEREVQSAFVENDLHFSSDDLFSVDSTGLVHGTLRDCLSILRRAGFVAVPPDTARARGMAQSLVVVEVPERQRIAVDVPGMLLVSDHVFRVFPWDRVQRLHAVQVARHAFTLLVAPHRASMHAHADAMWAPDADGQLFADLLLVDSLAERARLSTSYLQSGTVAVPLPGWGQKDVSNAAPAAGRKPQAAAEATVRRESAKELIDFAAFHPSVDQLLYAPKVAFGAALFGIAEEPDPDRNGADRARNGVPFGKFVLDKLRMRLGPKGFARAVHAHVFEAKSWREAAAEASGDDLDWFWRQWVAPHRKLAYRLVAIDSEALPGGGWRTSVTVERLGETWIREPVVVEVRDRDDHHVRAVWDAPGSKGRVTVVTPAKYDEVQLDPDGILAQDPTLGDLHPRWDDRTSTPWKPPVFSQLGASYAATENRLDFDVAFSTRKRFDLDAGYSFVGSKGARGYGAAMRYLRGFGPTRDLNSRLGGWSMGVGGNRAPNGFGRGTRPVTEVELLAGIGWDTVRQIQDPLTGWGASIGASLNFAAEDGARYKPGLLISSRAHVYFWEHVRTSSVLIGGAGVVLGPALDTQLLGLGSRQYLRGFEANEFLVRSRAYLIFEQRLKVLSGMFVDILHGTWLKAIELVPFAAAAAVSSKTSAVDFSGKGHFVGEVGLGLRILHEYFGVQPGVVSIDFAFPIGRPFGCAVERYTAPGYVGREIDPPGSADPAGRPICARTRQPFGFWLSAEQTY